MARFDEVLADLSAAGLSLRRAWPRTDGHLLLDLDDLEPGEECAGESDRGESGNRVAGQWFADADIATKVASATEGARRHGRVVLQPAGADRRLGGLAALLCRPGTRLVAHRPERRAVVALDGGARFAKLVPRRRLGRLHHAAHRANQLPIRTPRVLSEGAEDALVTGALPGTPLPELLGGPRAAEALYAVGAALAQLHRCPALAGSTVHGPSDEVAVTTRWEDWARVYGLPIGVPEDSIPSAGDPSGSARRPDPARCRTGRRLPPGRRRTARFRSDRRRRPRSRPGEPDRASAAPGASRRPRRRRICGRGLARWVPPGQRCAWQSNPLPGADGAPAGSPVRLSATESCDLMS